MIPEFLARPIGPVPNTWSMYVSRMRFPTAGARQQVKSSDVATALGRPVSICATANRRLRKRGFNQGIQRSLTVVKYASLEFTKRVSVSSFTKIAEHSVIDVLTHKVHRTIAQQKLDSSHMLTAEVNDVIGRVRRALHGHHAHHCILPHVPQN